MAWLIVAAALTAGCDEAGDPVTPGNPPGGEDPAQSAPVLNDDLGSRGVFPSDNWWNLDVSAAPVDPGSDQLIDWICERSLPGEACHARLHPDFGPPPYGIPYMTVGGDQPRVPVDFVLYGAESDVGAPGEAPGYPIPSRASSEPGFIEGGQPGGGDSGDRHLLVVDRDRWMLYELWATSWNRATMRWEAGSGAVFDLAANTRRPEGWTSADAAGLAVLPGLVKYHEVAAEAEIGHAFRVTVRATNGYVWPASHRAGSNQDAPPLGTRLRLRGDLDLSSFAPPVQRALRAMQRHGLIVADNGSDLFVQGTMDARWDNDVWNPAFHGISADDFEVVELGWRP